ncbi:hypothetical protein DMC47_24805 [Nostoc sp. 3335mG]|nr:hypothetical protein DMC47_24805 [Nostoc sp. 3335mG]
MTKAETALAEFAGFHEGYVRHYIALADTKAAILLGLTSTFIAFLFSRPSFHDVLFKPSCSWQTWLVWAAVALLLIGSGFAARVIAPRLKHTGEGLVFFGAVRAYSSAEAYADAVRSAGQDRLDDARLQHCYDVSAVCWRKYHSLRLAIWLSLAGFVASLPLIASI